ncbi:MAG: GNAT family N-acetyltransferase [Deltaproteobacteria bacterium]|nr:GNAT family N-acetyltransferase [Deltaproteobacteria bacterium]MDQ3300571.1 GNAT family N-acetyltransferase [Myxococcota bacterium]
MDTSKLAISVRRARPSDAAALADLVNRAYAVEGFFVEGQRTSPAEIERLVCSGSFLVLERAGEGTIAAAVYVDPGADTADRSDVGYIGMLSVEPTLQGMGLGTRLVRIAEAMCEAMGATAVRLRIVNLREELARWYRSLGYREVGTAPYDDRPVKQPCHFVEMYKPLVASVAA